MIPTDIQCPVHILIFPPVPRMSFRAGGVGMLPGCRLSSSIASGGQVSTVPYNLESHCFSYDSDILKSAGHWDIEECPHSVPHSGFV